MQNQIVKNISQSQKATLVFFFAYRQTAARCSHGYRNGIHYVRARLYYLA